jgi:sugar/nucleoside kinase (ribokinase family)
VNDHLPIDYFLVGHVAQDLTPEGVVPGGTVTFSAHVGRALGCRVAVLTSSEPGLELTNALGEVPVVSIPAAQNTTFENIYSAGGRQQFLHARAAMITARHVPKEWRRAPIVHLGPIADEIDPAIINLFSNSLVGLTPQGWMRGWDEDGRVYPKVWAAAREVLPLAAAVILSEEDLPTPSVLQEFRQWAGLTVLTQQERGCTVFWHDEVRQIPAPRVSEVYPTGAGDIFATAFLIRLYLTKGDAWAAAEFATRIATLAVSQPDLGTKTSVIQREWPGILGSGSHQPFLKRP